MATVQDVLDAIEQIAPARYAFPDDRIGLQVGSPSASVSKGFVALDWSEAFAEHALGNGAQLLVVHHPLIWEPLQTILESEARGRVVARLIRSNASYIACHTNWDAAPGGISDTLAASMGLSDVRPLGVEPRMDYVKIVTFCPKESADAVVDAMSGAGAGVIGLYERCAFGSAGTGTFRGLEGANPTVGRVGQVVSVEELRIEMRAPKSIAVKVVEALRAAHPYEEPPVDTFPLEPVDEMPLARIGSLKLPLPFGRFVESVDDGLSTRSFAWGDPSKDIRTVAVVGGAGDGYWSFARSAGADAFLTGEIRQHVALEGSQTGLGLVASGHYATEHPGCRALRERLASLLPSIEWTLFEPEPGQSGRPL